MVSIMHEKSVWAFMLALLALGLNVAPTVAQAPGQDAGNWLPVTIVYNADVGGKIDPCG